MKLTSVTVRNFRSYVVQEGVSPQTLEVGEGVNLLVGRNNCGKSNLLRALSLALEDSGGEQFDPEHDIPTQLSKRAYPVITLRFKSERRTDVDNTLLKLAHDYERSAGAKVTYAENGELVLRVVYRGESGRDESFAVKGMGVKKGDEKKLVKLLTQFRKCVRFIYLRSGESLNNFLSGAFKELLQTVLQEHLASHVSKAEKRREQYIAELTADLLAPLGNHAQQQLSDVMEEIQEVTVEPFVPNLEETLSKANIFVGDSAKTTLLNKGTGVRGALLVALLSYIAKHSRRSLVLAVEEPESFLHPGAQKDLRTSLGKLAKRRDVTLLVTTHSPFLLDRNRTTTITSLAKNPEGQTEFTATIRGDEPHAPVIGSLFGETITPAVLSNINELAEGTKAVVFVEGVTDALFIKHAAAVAERQDLIEGIEFRTGHGAHKSAVEAILLKQMLSGSRPVAALFDHDEMGKSAASLLKNKFQWDGRHVLLYRKWKMMNPATTPVEAEDLFPQSFLESFIKANPDNFLAEKMQYKNGDFHYGFTQDAKEIFVKYVESNLKKQHTTVWLEVLETLRKNLRI